jgi:polyisoprenoid-binding protein YceI
MKIQSKEPSWLRRTQAVIFSALLGASLIGAGDAVAADYTIDASHSSVGFKVRHLAISSVPGVFTDVKGSFSFDPAALESGKAEAVIGSASVDTKDVKRDEHLRGADFLNAAQFGAITFKSSKVEKVSDAAFKVHGNLTIRGATQPVVLDVTYGGSAKDPWGKERVAFVANTTIDRKAFGLTWSKVLETGALVVGDQVQISLEIEGVKV